MEKINRIDPSFLHHGAVIDINDLVGEDIVDHFKQMYREVGQHGPFVIVDYLVRTGPDDYEIVPLMDLVQTSGLIGLDKLQSLRALGLVINTRHVRTLAHVARDKRAFWLEVLRENIEGDTTDRTLQSKVLMIVDEDGLHENAFDSTWCYRGRDLAHVFVTHPGGRQFRPNHTYVAIGNLTYLTVAKLVQWFPRPRAYADRMDILGRLMSMKTLHYFCSPVHCRRMDAEEIDAYPNILLELNLKKFKRWLKRNQSQFYFSAQAVQAVIDQYDAEALEREQQEAKKADESFLEDDEPETDEAGNEIIDEQELTEEDFPLMPFLKIQGD